MMTKLYHQIGAYLFSEVISNQKNTLTDELIMEVGLSAENILAPMRKTMVMKGMERWRGHIRDMVMSGTPAMQLLGARFTPTGIFRDDEDIYLSLKEKFRSCTDEFTKAAYASTLFFFQAFSKDGSFRNELGKYYGDTIKIQIPMLLRNYGTLAAARQALVSALADGTKKDKHWCYSLFYENLPSSESEAEQITPIHQYPNIGRFLYKNLKEDALPEPVLEEVGLANADVIWPMKELVKQDPDSSDLLRKLILSSYLEKRLVGAKLLGGATDLAEKLYDLFDRLKQDFLSSADIETKTVFALTLPCFDVFQLDADIQKQVMSFLEGSIDDQIKIMKNYYGNIYNLKMILENSVSGSYRPYLRPIAELILSKLK